LDLDGFIDVLAKSGLLSSNLFERGEFNPAARLLLADLLEDMFRVLEQRALKERERARVLQRDDDRYIFPFICEAGLAPFQLLDQAAIERNFSQLVCFLLPLFCIRYFHRPPYASRSIRR